MIDLLSILTNRGLELRRVASTNGGEWSGPCPICGGRDRFRLWPKARPVVRFYCRGCGKHGDIIEFFRWADGLSYRAACEAAGVDPKRFDIARPAPAASAPRIDEFQPRVHPLPCETWRKAASCFVDRANRALLDNRAALDRLLSRRGINQTSVEKFKLGMAAAPLYRPRESWGLPLEQKSNGQPKRLWIPRGLVIPTFSDGQLCRVKIRRPAADLTNPDAPRYFAIPGSCSLTMRFGNDCKAYVVVESELDALLLCQQAEKLVGVIALGSAGIKPDEPTSTCLKRADVILVALDFDRAGNTAVKWWLKHFQHAKHWPPIEGKDPGEMMGRVDIQAWVMAGAGC